MTVTLGWWAIPVLFTASVFGGFAVWSAKQPAPSGWGDADTVFVELLALAVCVIAVLVAWLVWALLR